MRPLYYFVPCLSDVSASLMTALLVPALQVLTVMNILPRRRRSARVTKKLPLNHGQVDIAATTRHTQPCSIRHVPWGLLPNLPERTGQRYDKNKAPRGWVTANESVTSFLPPQTTNKRQKLRRLIKQAPSKSPIVKKDEEKNSSPSAMLPANVHAPLNH